MKTNYLLLIFVAVISSASTCLIVNKQGTIREMDSQKNQLIKAMDTLVMTNDSLKNEVFIYKTNQERYEIAIEMFKEENPLGYNQLQYIISHKTE